MSEPVKLPQRQAPQEKSLNQEFDTGGIARTLHDAAKQLLAKEVTASSVNAACNCAQQIANLIRVHLEAERLSVRLKNLKG